MLTVAIPCKGRLQHLLKTLPFWLRQSNIQLLILDYYCPEDTAGVIRGLNDSRITTAKVIGVDDGEFKRSHARNILRACCQTDWMLMCDADIWPNDRLFLSRLDALTAQNICFLVPNDMDVRHGLKYTGWEVPISPHGTVLVAAHKTAFTTIRGYDERMRGWGYEDTDFVVRLFNIFKTPGRYPVRGLHQVPHPLSISVQHHKDRDTDVTTCRNREYSLDNIQHDNLANRSAPYGVAEMDLWSGGNFLERRKVGME